MPTYHIRYAFCFHFANFTGFLQSCVCLFPIKAVQMRMRYFMNGSFYILYLTHAIFQNDYLLTGTAVAFTVTGYCFKRNRKWRDFLQDLEKQLCEGLGTKVRIRSGAGEKGRIEIEYYSMDDLNRLSDLLR